MQWQEDGIILGLRKHGEANAILELMTRGHGRHFGLVRGGRGSKLSAVLQPGNSIEAVWQARLAEHLGTYAVEPKALRAAGFMGNAAALFCLSTVAALLRLLPERDPHPGLYEALCVIVDHLNEPPLAAALLVRFELALLADLGFGLDLERCAATGARDELIYVSPKSGRAVSRAAGEPYREKLLALPRFATRSEDAAEAGPSALGQGLALTGHFLGRDVFGPRAIAMPEARASFIRAVCV